MPSLKRSASEPLINLPDPSLPRQSWEGIVVHQIPADRTLNLQDARRKMLKETSEADLEKDEDKRLLGNREGLGIMGRMDLPQAKIDQSNKDIENLKIQKKTSDEKIAYVKERYSFKPDPKGFLTMRYDILSRKALASRQTLPDRLERSKRHQLGHSGYITSDLKTIEWIEETDGAAASKLREGFHNLYGISYTLFGHHLRTAPKEVLDCLNKATDVLELPNWNEVGYQDRKEITEKCTSIIDSWKGWVEKGTGKPFAVDPQAYKELEDLYDCKYAIVLPT